MSWGGCTTESRAVEMECEGTRSASELTRAISAGNTLPLLYGQNLFSNATTNLIRVKRYEALETFKRTLFNCFINAQEHRAGQGSNAHRTNTLPPVRQRSLSGILCN